MCWPGIMGWVASARHYRVYIGNSVVTRHIDQLLKKSGENTSEVNLAADKEVEQLPVEMELPSNVDLDIPQVDTPSEQPEDSSAGTQCENSGITGGERRYPAWSRQLPSYLHEYSLK